MKTKLALLLAFILSFGVPAYAQQWDQVNGSMQVKSGPTAPLVIVDQTNTGQKIQSWRNNGTEKCYIDTSGNFSCSGTMLIGSCITFTAGTTFCEDAVNVLSQSNTTAAQRWNVFNTKTSAVNYESFSVDWQTTANVAVVGTRTAATGTGRTALFGSQFSSASAAFAGISTSITAPYIRLGVTTTAVGAASLANTGNYVTVFEQTTEGATSGNRAIFAILPTYNQSSGTAANTDWLVKRTPTALGSGRQLFIDTQLAASTSMFSVTAGSTGVGTQIAAAQQTVPTCSTNCGTSPAVVGSDSAMRVTMGSSGVPASGWVVTFNGTWPVAPVCSVTMAKTGMVTGKDALTVVTTTTTITVVTNGTAPATTDVYSIICLGVQ